MTPNQLKDLHLFLEGLALGAVDPALIPLIAMGNAQVVQRAIVDAEADEHAVLAPLRMIKLSDSCTCEECEAGHA